MKNMKISLKLIISFLVVIVLAVIVGAVGIFGMYSMNKADDEMYNDNLMAISYLGQVRANYNMQRAAIRDLSIYDADSENFTNALSSLADYEKEMDNFLTLYGERTTDAKEIQNYETIKNTYYGGFAELKKNVSDAGKRNDNAAAVTFLSRDGAAVQAIMTPLLTESMDINSQLAQNAVNGNTNLFISMTIVEVIVLVAAIAISMFFALYVSSLISKPMSRMQKLMLQVGTTGSLDVSPDLASDLEKDAHTTDEVGQSIKSFNALIKHIKEIAESLQTVANGDLTSMVHSLSKEDNLGESLIKMQDSLNNMFAEINSSSNQVSTGSTQIADGAQLLAQGATEQSATVEELSASIHEISEQTKLNSNTANEAKDLGESIKVSAEQGNNQMEQMMQAVREINEASQSIGKVIKIIDDIAFQTNILALNAAVEAARAGQHGKGFAVVADEVRSLAAKSAEAAKNTNELIETSIKKAEMGAAISQETSESLRQIVEGILHSSELISEIAKSSSEQTIAISQISEAVEQVSQVVQQNSATAEESAAASEEMSGQATMLQQLIAQFKIRNSQNRAASSVSMSSPASVSVPSSSGGTTGFSLSGDSKY